MTTKYPCSTAAAFALPLILLLASCKCGEEAAPSSPPEAADPVSEPAPLTAILEPDISTEPAMMFSCEQNRDCVNSCRHGAVSRVWYAASYPGGEDCRGGCAGTKYEGPRCVAGICTAFRGGEPDPECTRKEVEVLPGPGPAHACVADGDCVASCLYGAVNAAWYDASPKLRGECKGGCAGKGLAVRCVGGICAIFEGGTVETDCTRRPIFEVY